MRLRLPLAVFAGTLLLIFSLTGCKAKKSPMIPQPTEVFKGVIDTSKERLKTGKRGGTIIRADIPELDTFNVVITRSKPVYSTLKLIFEPLLTTHPVSGEIQGGIAKEYSIINNGHSLLLLLNENVRFSDGHPCTADDVVFTFEEIYMNPDVDSKKTDLLKVRDKLISIQKKDDLSVQIDLPVPYRPFLYALTKLEILPAHILSPLMEEGGVEAFNRSWGNTESALQDVIGTGPYILEEYKKGELIRLSRNPYYGNREGSSYMEGMPFLDEVVQLLGVDDETKRLKFQIGEIDFYEISAGDILSGDIESLLQSKAEGNYELYCAGNTMGSDHFLVFNQNPVALAGEKLELFGDRRFREAVSLLIDRRRIIREVYRGYAFSHGSPVRDVSPYYKEGFTAQYDPEKAIEILAGLGLADRDGDGILDLSPEKSFQFSLYTNQDNPLRMRMAHIIVEILNEAGIAVELKPIDYDLAVTKLLDTFEWEAVIIGIEGTVEPNDASWVWESKGPLHLWAPYQESPLSEWEGRIDELFALGRTTWMFEEAKAFYFEYQDIVRRQMPVIPIVVPAEIYGFRKGFGNVIPRASSYNTLALTPYLYRTEPN